MKHPLLAGIALAGLLALPAAAADHHNGGGSHGGAHVGGGHASGAHRSGGHMGGGAHFSSGHARGGRGHFRAHTHYGVGASHHHASHHLTHATRHAIHHAAHHAVHHEMRHAARHAAAAHQDRFHNVRRAVHASRRFHAGVYRRPNGWYARHWAIGERLPRGWFARDYWISDWAVYGLWAPIDGLIWVRVGPDAMLVDPVTGAIVAVDYALFW